MAKQKKEPDPDKDSIEPKRESKKKNESDTLSRRRWHVDEMPDKGLFAIIAFVGFVIIVSAKLLTSFPTWMIAVLAAIVMFSYLVLALRIPKLVLRLDRLGDNFYYLGFIFTLASLSAALIQIQSSGSVVKSVLGSFGIALLTTIIGVAGRVVLVQMRGELDEIEEETRRSLVERSETLKDEIGSMISDFSVLRTSISQLSTEVIEVTSVTLDERLDLVTRAAEGAAGRLDESFASQLKNVDGIEQSFERMNTMSGDATSKMAATFEENSSAVRNIGEEALIAIRAATERQDAMLMNAAEAFKSKIEIANQVIEHVKQAKTMDIETVENLASTSGMIDDRMKELLLKIDTLSVTFERGIKEMTVIANRPSEPSKSTYYKLFGR